jgi:hypothetical protein
MTRTTECLLMTIIVLSVIDSAVMTFRIMAWFVR